MKVTELHIRGPLLIECKRHEDARGFFCERYRRDQFKEIGLPEFVQDNYSRSLPGVLRGLHFQYTPPQGKLVTAVSGAIFDVIVDIRSASPTYGQTVAVELFAERPSWFWVPAGFAHGFQVLGNAPADVLYKVDCPYSPGGEGSIRWDDHSLNITWPQPRPLLSSKDAEAPDWAAYKVDPKF